jgi:transcriptional regulator GlxA family with amidase domain
MSRVECAVVVYDGVQIDEFQAFWCVLCQLDGLELKAVGKRAARYAGPGGAVVADAAFDDVDTADIVVVPGGLGCEQAATDPVIAGFLQRVGSDARHVAASSTGSVILAAAGLLHGESAATHWLASDLLERFGSHTDERRVVTHGNTITCTGAMTALDAALLIVDRVAGPAEVERVKRSLADLGDVHLRSPARWQRFTTWLRSLYGGDVAPVGEFSTADRPPVTPLSVMIELVEDGQQVEKLRQQAGRRSKRRR